MDPEKKEICLRVFDFRTDDFKDEKELKKNILTEICLKFDDPEIQYGLDFYVDVIDVIEGNLFRVLPPSQIETEHINIGPGFEKYISTPDPQIEHLDSVYLLLYSLLEFLNFQVKNYISILIDKTFITKLIALIKSEDEDERIWLVKIIKNLFTFDENCRSTIYNEICQCLMEVNTDKTFVHCHVDSLLNLTFFIISNYSEPNQEPFLLRTFIALHRLPYLYYFYENLFSCCLFLLENNPSQIVPFTKNILFIQNSFLREAHENNKNSSTKRILYFIEINKILDLLNNFIEDSDQVQEKETYLKYFSSLASPIVKFCADGLKSGNQILVNWSCKILTCPEYRQYFTSQKSLLREQLMPIVKEQSTLLEWDGATFTEQMLVEMYLDRLLN